MKQRKTYQELFQSAIDRFNKQFIIDYNTNCWNWSGLLTKTGYGKIQAFNKTTLSHRLSYLIHKGEIPEGLFVCHSCDNPKCVNPNHLWLGTASDNMKDRDNKGRQASGDRNGARLHPEKMSRGKNHHYIKNPETIPKGEELTQSKLTNEQVIEIYNKFYKKGVPISQLVIEYNTCKTNIHSIIKGNTWSHITEEIRNKETFEDMMERFRLIYKPKKEVVKSLLYKAKGESAGNVKLTEENIIDIYTRYQNYEAEVKELANQYNVNRTCIQKIVSNQTWLSITSKLRRPFEIT